MSEFHLAGGSIRCLTNPVDLTLGRDLPAVPGGEVVLPPSDADRSKRLTRSLEPTGQRSVASGAMFPVGGVRA